jgi:hypothetical protein
MATNTRPKRQQGRPSDVASVLSTESLYLPWKHDLPRRVEECVGEPTLVHRRFPSVVEVRDGERSARYHSGELHHQIKTFAELQQILIQSDLASAAAGRARMHGDHGKPDAVTRLRDSSTGGDR